MTWCPSIMTGLLQTEDYARELLSVHPDVTDEIVALAWPGTWHAGALFAREVPTLFLIDQLRCTASSVAGDHGGAATPPRQLAGRPRVTIQVVPAVADALRCSRRHTDRCRRVLGN